MTRTGQLELAMAEERTVEAAPDYAAAATEWIRGCLAGSTFTAEALRNVLGDPPGHGDVLGTVLRNARKAGLVRAAGHQASTRPERHGAVIVTWQRT